MHAFDVKHNGQGKGFSHPAHTQLTAESEPPADSERRDSGSMNCDLLRWAADVSHAGRLPHADAAATESNPMCGDRCHIEFSMSGDAVVEE